MRGIRFMWLVAVVAVLSIGDPAWAMPIRPDPAGPSSMAKPEPDGRLTGRRRSSSRKPKPTPEPAAEPATDAAAPESAPAGDSVSVGPGGRTRVDFDAMMIKGQTTKAGEVQVLERRDVDLKSMVKRRTSFREEIIRSVFPDQK